ncbi:MAG TPA: dephospho-CoA kinase [Pseudomonadaceae bacterium]|nr:dephospho-CoA kinase [Pseudomonadaceae bacterium]
MSQTHKRPFIAGLTGGIGSGKTTVSEMFAELGAEVIDADIISRALLAPGSATLNDVMEHFGERIHAADGSLDRSRLRAIIFAEPAAKQWLEQLLHPRIREEILRRIATSPRAWLLLSVPLLLESPAYDFVDTIVVVDIPEAMQLSRTAARDAVSAAEVRAIMATQMPREERLARADHVIRNDAGLQNLQQQVSLLFEKFEGLANAPHQAG